MVEFKPLPVATRNRLKAALEKNAADEWALLTGRDTSFVKVTENLPGEDEELVLNAIKSVPCHY